jgi:hypothetical protein
MTFPPQYSFGALRPEGAPAPGLADWIAAEALQPPEAPKGPSSVPWIAGGLVVLLAVGVYAIETKGPEPLRRPVSR